ncbi:MAG: ABC transporter permease, partial [Clostridia bacterium]|nr:ABC transporter permease [Clostridia bacterium]
LFIQHITDGGSFLDMRVYSAEISDFISSLIIYLCGFVLFFKTSMNKGLDRRAEKAYLAAKGGKAS